MSDRKLGELPFESESAAENRLWTELADLPRENPSSELKRRFYRDLDQASSRNLLERIRASLGMSNNLGWVTAAACLVVGVILGQMLKSDAPEASTRLVALEQNVALLNRELILDRLEDSQAAKRLRGVIDASRVAQDDAEIARALLMRATDDSVHSIRTAAIEALGPRLNTSLVGSELMRLLETETSPLVQLALVDLVLRHGSRQQLDQLLSLAQQGRLHTDLVTYVENTLGRESI